MLVPGIIITAIYSYGAIIGNVIAFQRYNFTNRGFFGLFKSPWIGFANFSYIFALRDFKRAFGNTLYLSVFSIVLGILVPLVVSLLLNEVRHTGYKRAVQTLIYLPFFISWVIVAGIMQNILSPSSGVVNHVMGFFGIKPIFFLADPKVFRAVLIISNQWKGFGMGTIIYLAALTAIDPSLYEAAGIDGANRFKKMLYISLPGLIPIIVLNGTLSLGSVLNSNFDQIQNLYSTVVYSTGDVIDTLVYRLGIQPINAALPRYDLASAIGLFKSAISFVLVSVTYFFAYKFADYRIF